MTSQDDAFSRVDHPPEIQELVEHLSQAGAASLALEKNGGEPLPVVVFESQPGESLLLDISAIRHLAADLRRGAGFRLLGQARGGVLRTPLLSADMCFEREGRMLCRCDYPPQMEILQRRDTFRAPLRLGMEVGVVLRDRESGLSAQGDLRDLSLEGCLVELSASAMTALMSNAAVFELELCYPNGTRFVARGSPRHQKVDAQRGLVKVGFLFGARSAEDDRRLWFMVREIEREAARMAGDSRTPLAPSVLFEATKDVEKVSVSRRQTQDYATAMTRRLAPTAAYLDNQILELRQGGMVDAVQLSRHADRLLALQEEDREALLFAVQCLDKETLLVRHSLGVSTHLLDFAKSEKMPHELCKALAAAGLVHDLGKALLPRDLLEMQFLNASQYRWLQGHVTLILQRLERCRWLATSVVEAVVRDINERLDGQGYPHGRGADQLPELARLAAVVDVSDVMARVRPGRRPWSAEAIQEHLHASPHQFDRRWVARHQAHFGRWPVGSLVRYPGGLLAWVRRLDDQRMPVQVQISRGSAFPGSDPEQLLEGGALDRLGEPLSSVPAPD
jgi:HD-GYP domain-containing protein (c-di-GMP phosphodiesterase class II)